MLKYSKLILKYNYSTGLLGYSPIFNLNEPDETNLNNNNDSKKYKLMNSKVIFNTSTQNKSNKNNTNSNLNEKKKKIDELLIHYTDMYNSYNYNKIISKKKKEIDNLCINYHSISSKLSKKSYTNIFDLLNLLLDQEYYLINFILNLNDIELYKKTLRQDNTIRKYIKRNILNFSSYMDEYKVKAPKIGEIDMFSIQDYDINTFFKTTNT